MKSSSVSSDKEQQCRQLFRLVWDGLSVAQALETDDQENEVVLRKIQERMQR